MRKALAIVRAELWQRRWGVMWWSIGISAFIVINLAVYPSFKEQAQSLNDALANLPQTVKELFSDNGDFASPSGYLSSQIFYLLLPMLFSILAINLGSSLLAKDEHNGTLELLMARPVARRTILFSKALAGLVELLAVGFVAMIVTLLGARLAGVDLPVTGIMLTTFVSLLLGVFLGSIAFTLTALGRLARMAAIGIASLVGLSSYIVASLSSSVAWLKWPAKLSPYMYYHTSEILNGHTTGKKLILSLSIICLALLAAAWLGFRRRDIESK